MKSGLRRFGVRGLTVSGCLGSFPTASLTPDSRLFSSSAAVRFKLRLHPARGDRLLHGVQDRVLIPKLTVGSGRRGVRLGSAAACIYMYVWSVRKMGQRIQDP